MKKWKWIMISVGILSASTTLVLTTYFCLRKNDELYEISMDNLRSNKLEKVTLNNDTYLNKFKQILKYSLYENEDKTIFYTAKKSKNIESNYHLINLYSKSGLKDQKLENEFSNIFNFQTMDDWPFFIFDNYLYTLPFNKDLKEEQLKEMVINYLSKRQKQDENYYYDNQFSSFEFIDFVNVNIKIFVALKFLKFDDVIKKHNI